MSFGFHLSNELSQILQKIFYFERAFNSLPRLAFHVSGKSRFKFGEQQGHLWDVLPKILPSVRRNRQTTFRSVDIAAEDFMYK